MKLAPEVKAIMIILLLFVSALSAAGVFGDMYSGSQPYVKRKECSYTSVIDFFPSRIIVCELWRERWTEK